MTITKNKVLTKMLVCYQMYFLNKTNVIESDPAEIQKQLLDQELNNMLLSD